MNAIEVRGLTRRFGDLTAVDGIDFEVRQDEIFGFLGPNGAGKTTTISMLCTLLKPSAGQAVIAGHNINTQPSAVRRSIGLIFQDPSLDEQLTGRENLRFHAMLYDLTRAEFEQRAREVLEMVELTEKADDIVRTYSGGMRRRLEIARGLLHHPRVLFLDEPTLGLDPQTRRHIWDYLRQLREEQGVTMFMTTHYMDEAENCDRIAIIDHGKIVSLDTPDELKALVGGDVLTVRTSDNALALERLQSDLDVNARHGPDGQLIIEIADGDQFIPRMVSGLAGESQKLRVQSVSLRRPTLEDVFIKLTGRAIREEEADSKDHMRIRRRIAGRRR
ncbi:MAG: ATP-binding cassette domain-containing protein [Anaerolineales bacterium]